MDNSLHPLTHFQTQYDLRDVLALFNSKTFYSKWTVSLSDPDIHVCFD